MYQCSICYENYNQYDSIPIILIPCGHTFCSKCIYDLQSYGYKECSLCRENINYIEINIILYELMSNRNKTDNNLQKLLTTKIREIIDSDINHSIRVVLFNEYLHHYNNLDTNNIRNTNSSSSSSCCIIC